MIAENFIPTLVLTQNFLPAKGETITLMLNTYGRYQSREAIFVTEQCEQGGEVDKALPNFLKVFPTAKYLIVGRGHPTKSCV